MRHSEEKAIQLSRSSQHICETLFNKVKLKLSKATPTTFFEIENFEIYNGILTTNDIFKIIKEKRHGSHLDYSDEHVFHVYDRRFFYRNLMKYIIVSYELQVNYPLFSNFKEIIDVGSGVGTFALAWLLVKDSLSLSSGYSDPSASVKITLLDTSRYQLAVAVNLLRYFFDKSPLEISVVNSDLVQSEFFNETNLALCGYVFSSVNYNAMHRLVGKTIIVDYEEKIDELYEMARSIRYPTHRKKYKYSGSDFIMDIKSVGLQVNCIITGPKKVRSRS